MRWSKSLGINAFQIKLATFVIAALLAAHVRLALCASWPLRQPDAVRRHHGHRFPDDGDGRRLRRICWARVVGAAIDHAAEEFHAGLSAADRAGRVRPARDRRLSRRCSSCSCNAPARHRPVSFRGFCRNRKQSRPPEAAPRCRAASSRRQARVLMKVERRRSRRFGGLVAVNDVSFEVQVRRNPRADRPERRRQDDDVQPAHRRAARQQRRDRVRGPHDHPRPAIPHRPRPASRAPSSTSSCARA